MIRINTVLIDIDDTLLPSSDIERASLSKSYSFINDLVILSLDEFITRMREIRRRSKDENQYFYTPDHFLIFLNVNEYDKNLSNSGEVLAMKMYVSYTDEWIQQVKLYDTVIDFLTYLRKNSYTLFIVSSGVKWNQYEKLIRTQISDYFQGYYISTEETKLPNLLQAIQENNLDPVETVYIGDNPEKDVLPAKEAGMISIRLRQGRRAKQDSKVSPDYEFASISKLFDFFKRSVTGPSPPPF